MSLGGVTLQRDERPKLRSTLRTGVHTLLRTVNAGGVVPQAIFRWQVNPASGTDVVRHVFRVLGLLAPEVEVRLGVDSSAVAPPNERPPNLPGASQSG